MGDVNKTQFSIWNRVQLARLDSGEFKQWPTAKDEYVGPTNEKCSISHEFNPKQCNIAKAGGAISLLLLAGGLFYPPLAGVALLGMITTVAGVAATAGN